MTTHPKYDFRSLAITNIGCDEARKIMDFFIHMLDRKINFKLSTQKNVMLLAEELSCKETEQRRTRTSLFGATGSILTLRGRGITAPPFSSPL